MSDELRELILHVDINKTIVAIDPGDHCNDLDTALRNLICQQAWGQLVENVEEVTREVPIEVQPDAAAQAKSPTKPAAGKGAPKKEEKVEPQFEKVTERIVTYEWKLA